MEKRDVQTSSGAAVAKTWWGEEIHTFQKRFFKAYYGSRGGCVVAVWAYDRQEELEAWATEVFESWMLPSRLT